MPTHSSFIPLSSRLASDPVRRISAVDPKLSRSNYFDGKLLRASDLIRDQLYLDERLREAGRATGSGIVRGFDVSLSLEGVLTVSPGLAIAPSGRVLEHEGPQSLTVNLFDTASFAALNPDSVPRLRRGLYAVVARLATQTEGAAEVFPADLGGERGFHPNAFTEGVELVLTDLRARLPGLSRRVSGAGRFDFRGIQDRAALAREFLANAGQPAELDDDAVALGLLAVEDGGPLWLDHALVRRPHRPDGMPGTAQADLMSHHEELLTAILADRAAANRTGAFAATDYFDRLPPAGRLPASSIDPAAGNQRFFPDTVEVSIAPVRDTDLPAILAEAALLDPIDLNARDPAAVMVLVPLPDGSFDTLARRVELDPTDRSSRETAFRNALEALNSSASAIGEVRTRLQEYEQLALVRTPLEQNRLPSINPLDLRARGTPAPLDTDVAAWRAIQAEAASSGQVWFVRRAPRAAATEVSAVVAARGIALPPLTDAPATEIAGLRSQLAVMTRERSAAEARVRELQAQVTALQRQIDSDTSDDEISILTRRLATAESNLTEARRRIEQLEAELQRTRQLEADLANASAEIVRLRRLLDDTSGEDRLRADITRLDARLAESNRLLRAAQIELAQTRIDPDRLIATRRIEDERAMSAAREVLSSASAEEAALVQRAALISPASKDAALWPSLLEAQQKGVLKEFVGTLEESLASEQDIETVGRNVSRLGLSEETMRLWTVKPATDNRIRRDVVIGRDAITPVRNFAVARPVEVTQTRTVRQLAAERGFRDSALIVRVADAVGTDRTALLAVNRAVAATPQLYDTVLWPSLDRVIARNRLAVFADFLVETATLDVPLGLAVAAEASRFSLLAVQRNGWSEIDFERAGGQR